MHRSQQFALATLIVFGGALATATYGATTDLPVPSGFTLRQVLGYPFPSDLVASRKGNRIAWLINLKGVRNIWVADAPMFAPRQVTHFTQDDGQELTQLTFSPDGNELVFVRGGDHDANWAEKVPADPTSSPIEPKVMLWMVDLRTHTARALTDGDAPAISADDRLAYIKQGQVWTAPLVLHAKAQPHRLFFDHGQDGDLHWSPDGKRLAFVSDRGDHAFIGVYANDTTPLLYLAPSTHIDGMPRWSPVGSDIAFVRQPGNGGRHSLFPYFSRAPEPWSIVVANARTGEGHAVWRSPDTATGTLLLTYGEANLHWADHGKRLVFMTDLDGWAHLYSMAAHGGKPLLLTPGKFMVQDVALSRDSRSIFYSANTGTTKKDQGRRHLYSVPVDRAQPVALTAGTGLQWSPTVARNAIAYIEAGAQRPPQVAVMNDRGSDMRPLQSALLPKAFPTAQLVTPKTVSFKAADGTLIHGQLFRSPDATPNQPGVIFVHGGPPRQMLLGWHPMGAYSSMYAVNQYLATHGFTVLSVNYRLSIGYGHAFQNPPHAGPTGASEYQDVLAGAKFLQRVSGVDPTRIGIWGASYGGYLTALALARNSDIFKAGVDMLGVHNFTLSLGPQLGNELSTGSKQEQEAPKQALRVAWESSPDASIATWKSPVLLIQGDDDHNVHFAQMEDVVQRLRKHHVPFEEMVIPNEVHDFRRYASWLRAYAATVDFLQRKLGKN
ncbi:MAG: S9 family peptidase [Steroidobacteraceae bacterium]